MKHIIHLFIIVKASLIVGTSIPISIFTALILMNLMGFSMNVITMSAIVMGVGMMVDNSIVVLESCFRATDARDQSIIDYAKCTLSGTNLVVRSIIGSTLTTCVVFLPLAFITGMTGQIFKPLGFTIVFCMTASLLSAMTIVPLCYRLYRPLIKENAPMNRPVARLQNTYYQVMGVLLPKKKTVIFVSLILLAGSFFIASQLQTELMPSDDQGEIGITVETRPGLGIAGTNEIIKQVESIVTAEADLESYMVTYGGSGVSLSSSNEASLTAYLKKNREKETKEVIALWQEKFRDFSDCEITVELNSSMSMMSQADNDYEVILKGTQYDEVKESSDSVVQALYDSGEVTNVHSTLENAAPVIDIKVDTVMAAAEGFTPTQIAYSVNQMISGTEAATLDVDGEEISIQVEYPKGSYESRGFPSWL